MAKLHPEVLAELKARGIAAVFGDVSSLDTLEHHHLKEAKLIFCTIPDVLLKGTDNLTLTKSCRVIAPEATVIATADDAAHEQKLQEAGAGFVVKPYELSGGRLARYVREWSAFGGAIEMGAAAILGPPPGEVVQAACECQQVRKAA